ncbi:MAG: 4-hydroxybenzoate octaprenyltransferase [Magnetococcales bacterium]|nr:4-hydroxybenzoate octaprenyltransferase [Magnetococcales bacterium]
MMARFVEWLPWPLGREMLRLMRVDRPIGTWLLLWPSLWALAAARPGAPDGELLLIFVLGAFLMRSAGCVANDLADRHIDPHVARTRDRPLAAGRISVGAARVLLLALLILALLLVSRLEPLALLLAPVGALLAVSYPFAKRFIHLPQFYLGAAFGWGVIMAWAAATGSLAAEAWILFGATLTWAAGYDTVYAMMDREDDRRIGVKSTALLFGRWDRHWIALLYAATLGLLGWAGYRLELNPLFHGALLGAGGQMVWQLLSIAGNAQAALLRAFLSNRWAGALIWVGFMLGGW